MKSSSIKQLNNFKKKIDKEIDIYFNNKKNSYKKSSPSLAEILDHIHSSCKKGKRIRAAFIYFSYLAHGGTNQKEILKLSSFVELMHTYFLIHDDIVDQDAIRHGIPTIHTKYQEIYKKYRATKLSKPKDSEHFGNSVAIIAGDLTNSLSYDIIINSKIDDKIKNQILTKTNSLVFTTLAGQFFDINQEQGKIINKQEILNIYQNKTAQYTVEIPLQIGAIAAGKNNQKILKTLSSYAIPLGIAFQIQDDILDIFGNEEKLGKPIGSDIREGKCTILIWAAFQKADENQTKILKSYLGNKKLSQKQIEEFKQIIINTGSLTYAKEESNKLLNQSLNIIKKLKLKKEGKEFLVGIAEYLINREY